MHHERQSQLLSNTEHLLSQILFYPPPPLTPTQCNGAMSPPAVFIISCRLCCLTELDEFDNNASNA